MSHFAAPMVKNLPAKPRQQRYTIVKRMLWLLLALVLALAAYILVVFPILSQWGATNAETQLGLPGDDLVSSPSLVTTKAITIQAQPTDVWPWLAQLGVDRGGMYSYLWVENWILRLNVVNSEEINPEWQSPQVGDFIRFTPTDYAMNPGPGLYIMAIDPGHSLVGCFGLESTPPDCNQSATWQFVLLPLEGGRDALDLAKPHKWQRRFHIYRRCQVRLCIPVLHGAQDAIDNSRAIRNSIRESKCSVNANRTGQCAYRERQQMTESFKLLIAYDGSPGSDEAIDDLQRAGLPANVNALVLSVADTWVLPQGETTEPQPVLPNAMMRQARASATAMIDAATNQAERGAERVRQLFPHWKVTAESAAQGPAWAITLKGEEWGADLVVVGSRGYSQLQRLVLGSVSYAVLSHARCSVRVARGRPTQHNRPLRILVAVDGSQEAEHAVQVVSKRVWPAGTDIRLIMVLNAAFLEEITSQSPQRATTATSQTAASDEFGEVDEVEGMIGGLLKEYAATIEQNQTSATVSSSLVSGEPRRVLLEVAQEWGADCIFIGSRGLNRWERLLLGSVSLAVAEGASSPVEVIRKPMR